MSSTIDAHHHLWDLDVTPQPWLSESMPRINRSFLLPDLTVAVGRRIDRTVIVQTVSDEAETLWMLNQAARSERGGFSALPRKQQHPCRSGGASRP